MNHLEAFKAFVATQDPDKRINHVEGYSHCAIGAYGNTIGVTDDMDLCSVARDIINQQRDLDNRCIDSVINEPSVARRTIPTYGKLSEFLNASVAQDEHSVTGATV